MDSLFGLPAHPLLVHIPVVLLPLAAVGVVVMAIKPAWHHRYRWAVLAMGVVGAIGAVLAEQAGESFEERIEALEGREAARRWHEHQEQGETARNLALLFGVILIAFVLVPWFLERRRSSAGNAVRSATEVSATSAGTATATGTVCPTLEQRLRIGLAVLAILGAAGSVYSIIQAGHSGADAVWSQYDGADEGD
jgi:hypothetical protein